MRIDTRGIICIIMAIFISFIVGGIFLLIPVCCIIVYLLLFHLPHKKTPSFPQFVEDARRR